MKRRDLLKSTLAAGAAGALGFPATASAAAPVRRVRPGQPGWPSAADWSGLKDAVGGRLAPVAAPDLSTPEAKQLLHNPFFVADQPALTESSGWLDAWRSAPSAYMVDARSAADVAAAVRFAAAHNLRLAVKGRGHSYLGASNAPDSLLIWTRHMDQVTVHEAFTPKGSRAAPVPAISCGGGAMWLHAYQAATAAGRYVQGGGCTTVGVAGLVQGGGFGSFSKGFGTAGSHLLEAEIVTADGQIRVVNRVSDPELFWALKGGGGGTWGVLTRLTLATHPLPATFGGLSWAVQAKSDDAYRRLLAKFVEVYATNLCNPHYGEQAKGGPSNRLALDMATQGVTPAETRAALAPLIDFVAAHPGDYDAPKPPDIAVLPAAKFWDAGIMTKFGDGRADARPGAAPTDFWWSGDGDQVGVFWHAYQSAWLPRSLLEPANQARLVDAWFAATRHYGVSFHLNKGLGGAPDAALAAARETPINADVVDAFALVIIATGGQSLFYGVEPNLEAAHANKARVDAAMTAMRACAPHAGSYVNETDYFQPDWQHAFWRDHYPRLLRAKRRYDPTGLFTVHHGVGSEGWSADGFERRG